jgi:hypothetical protein
MTADIVRRLQPLEHTQEIEIICRYCRAIDGTTWSYFAEWAARAQWKIGAV